jgi:hypothetical protein
LDVDEKEKNGHNVKQADLCSCVGICLISPIYLLLFQFEETLSMPNPKEALQELIDPRLGGDYPIDSVMKVSDAGKLGGPTSSFCSTVARNKNYVLNCLMTCVLCTRSRTLQSHARMKIPG